MPRVGMSQRELARKHGVGRRTVVKALASAWPEPRKPLPPRPTRLDPFKPVIDAILRADLDAPRKQRHTTKRIFERLVDEHDAAEVSYQMARLRGDPSCGDSGGGGAGVGGGVRVAVAPARDGG